MISTNGTDTTWLFNYISTYSAISTEKNETSIKVVTTLVASLPAIFAAASNVYNFNFNYNSSCIKTSTPKINSSTKYISDWYAQYWSTTGKKLNSDLEKVLLPFSHVNTRMISSEKESLSQNLHNNHMKPKTVARIRDDFLTGVSDSKIPPIKYFSRLIIPLLSK